MIVDTNVSLSRWPFRRLAGDETADLVDMLRKQQVSQAWAGSFDGLLHKDVAAVNQRLYDECQAAGEGILVPFGTVNLGLPAWEEDVRRCHEVHKMPGIRLHADYHALDFGDPAFARLLAMAAERDLIVQLSLRMEDQRTQSPRLQLGKVDPAPLVDVVSKVPKLRLVLLNCMRELGNDQLAKLAAAGEVFFDIATREGVGGVASLLQFVGVDRVVFGSNAPYYYLESARMKMKESPLTEPQTEAILQGNARRLRGV